MDFELHFKISSYSDVGPKYLLELNNTISVLDLSLVQNIKHNVIVGSQTS